MKLAIVLLAGLLSVCSCVPVLDRTYMREGLREVSFAELRQNPEASKAKLYILGGVIVRTRFIEEGSQLEAMHVPVDRLGYLGDSGRSEGRFLALMPKDKQVLDPVIFHTGRKVALAAEFVETTKGKIDEVEYVYPVFLIRQIRLFSEERRYIQTPIYDPWPWPYPYPDRNRRQWWPYPHHKLSGKEQGGVGLLE